jgi:hypothetical protein
MMCDHTGTRSGGARYLRETGQLRLVLVCDQCGTECSELGRVDYHTQALFSIPQLPKLTPSAIGVAKAELSV